MKQNRLNSTLKMEPGSGPSKCPRSSRNDSAVESGLSADEQTGPDDNEIARSHSPEMSNSDNIKFKDLGITDINSCGESSSVHIIGESNRENDNENLTVDQNDNGKIPNRDSGIDSPSCCVVGEVFSNDETVEPRKLTLPVANIGMSTSTSVDQKRDSTQDEDSDMDEGSSEEHESTELTKAENNDATKVSFMSRFNRTSYIILCPVNSKQYLHASHFLHVECTLSQKVETENTAVKSCTEVMFTLLFL